MADEGKERGEKARGFDAFSTSPCNIQCECATAYLDTNFDFGTYSGFGLGRFEIY